MHPVPWRCVTLGTADATPQAHRGPTATLVSYGEQLFVVDMGSGALQKILRAGYDPADVDALFLTHAHVDHLGDVLPFFFGIAAGTIARARPLDVYASAQTLAHLRAMCAAFDRWVSRAEPNLRYHAIAPSQSHPFGALSLRTGAVAHTDSSVALKWTSRDGRTLAIPGDTGPHADLADFVRGADALVIECGSDPSQPLDTHLSPAQLRGLLFAARPHAAYVVHRPPALQNAALESYVSDGYDGVVRFPSDLDAFVL